MLEITRQAWQRFFDAQGWKLSEENLLAYGISEHVISDGPMPSPAAAILGVTQKLLKLGYGKTLPVKKFNAALAASEQQVLDDPFWFSSYIAIFGENR